MEVFQEKIEAKTLPEPPYEPQKSDNEVVRSVNGTLDSGGGLVVDIVASKEKVLEDLGIGDLGGGTELGNGVSPLGDGKGESEKVAVTSDPSGAVVGVRSEEKVEGDQKMGDWGDVNEKDSKNEYVFCENGKQTDVGILIGDEVERDGEMFDLNAQHGPGGNDVEGEATKFDRQKDISILFGEQSEEKASNDQEMVDAVNETKQINESVLGGENGVENRIQENGYAVGDFVWGKSGYLWRPGQIQDPSSASDYVGKLKEDGCLLVVYFGDDSFSWCSSSQLMPFAENFEGMSKQSDSKAFVNAVDKAVDKLSKLVEMRMTCKCVQVEDQIVVPISNGVKVMIDKLEPSELLSTLRCYAETVSVNDMMKFVVLKSWLSAFYRKKGGCLLQTYHPPQVIEGLEDKMRTGGTGSNGFGASLVVSLPGPSEERVSSLPKSVLQKCSNKGDGGSGQRRKRKSVSELMDAESEKKEVDEEGTGTGKKASKRKEADCSERTLSSGGKRRKKEMEGDGTLEVDVSTRKKRKEVKRDDITELDNKEETLGSPRERKKSKYLSPPFTSHGRRSKGSSSGKAFESELEKAARKARVGERLASVASRLVDSPNTYLKESTQAISSQVNVSDVRSELVSAALHPIGSKENKNMEMMTGFLSSYRSSVFINGSDYNAYHERQRGKKGKQEDLESEKGTNEQEKVDIPQSSEPTTLFLSFPPAFTLPSKDDLIQKFIEFGELNEKETVVLYNNFCARVVYVKSSDAEEALKASQQNNPFGAADVKYQLINPKPTSSKKTALEIMKIKLRGLTIMMEKSADEITAETKSKLLRELKELQAMVRKMN